MRCAQGPQARPPPLSRGGGGRDCRCRERSVPHLERHREGTRCRCRRAPTLPAAFPIALAPAAAAAAGLPSKLLPRLGLGTESLHLGPRRADRRALRRRARSALVLAPGGGGGGGGLFLLRRLVLLGGSRR